MAEKLIIFISGTMRGLSTERERVANTIRDMGLEPVWAEKRGATDRPSRDECERMARTCHIYLGLYGLSYGWKFPPEETISATEFEWQTAKRASKPMLIYRQKGQPDSEQADFLKEVGDWQQGRFWYEFETLDDLLPRLRDDLARLIAESFRPERPADLADFRAHLRRLYADLPLSGIPVPLDVTLPLDRVYIKLRALPEQEEAARRAAALPPDHDEDLPHRLAERLWRQREEGEEAAHRLEETKPIPPEEAIAQHERMVVLGEAGAGKSTLLRHLAWERAGDSEAPLPLLIPLGRADALISQTGRSFLEAALDLLTEHKAGEERELLKQSLAAAIRDKSVLFLCDGLDEAHLARRSVVSGLEKLIADGHRLVVTSRPLGYERLAAMDMENFQVLPLLPEDAQAFSGRWFQALAEARSVPEAEQEEWAAERTGWLQRQLDERPGLREVARNPLLLTFLAVLAGDEPQHELPQRRKELYKEYVERLFTVWEARRQREGKLVLGDLSGERARRVALWGLYRTAWYLHRAYYGEEELGAVHDTIEPLLARDLRERWEFDLLQAESLAVGVLRFWEGAGLLDVYPLAGQQWLAFRHLTFQEYGAARALAEVYGDDADGLWQCLSPHLLRPQWARVIPLTLAHLPEAQATILVKRLLKANKKDKDQQRPLLLAASTLAEGTKMLDASRRQVVDALVKLTRTGRVFITASHIILISVQAIEALGHLVGDGYAAAELLTLARNEAVWERKRVVAAWALGRLGWHDEASELLLSLAQARGYGSIRKYRARAAFFLGELGRVDHLLILARDQTVDDGVRLEAAEALGRLGRANEAAEFLLALARDRLVRRRVRLKAAEALERLERANEAAEAWLALAEGREWGDMSWLKAAEALGRLGRANEAAEFLLALARDQAVHNWVRVKAAVHLARQGPTEEAGQILLRLSQDERVDITVREQAAKALGELERPHDLLTLARDQAVDGRVREEAAEALERLGRGDELLALAHDETVDAWVREKAAVALARLGRVEEAAEFLLTLARDPAVEDSVREDIAEALERLELSNEAGEAWLALAQDRAVHWLVREEAMTALERLRRGDQLLTFVRDETVDEQVRVGAAVALAKLGRTEEAVEFLSTLAQNQATGDWVRLWAVAAIWMPLKLVDEAAEELLLTLARDWAVEAKVRMRAVVAWLILAGSQWLMYIMKLIIGISEWRPW